MLLVHLDLGPVFWEKIIQSRNLTVLSSRSLLSKVKIHSQGQSRLSGNPAIRGKDGFYFLESSTKSFPVS